jgi:hypothetical protein
LQSEDREKISDEIQSEVRVSKRCVWITRGGMRQIVG